MRVAVFVAEMAYLIKKGNRWHARWRGENGQWRQKATGCRVNPAPAEKARGITAKKLRALAETVAIQLEAREVGRIGVARALEAVRSAGDALGFSEAQVPTFRSFLRSLSWAATTEQVILRVASKFGLDLEKAIDKFSPAEMRAFFRLMSESMRETTLRQRFNLIKSLFSAAVKKGWIRESPCEGIEVPKSPKMMKREVFSREDVAKLMTLPGEWPDAVRVCLLLGGQRLGDIVNLRWASVDFNAHEIDFVTQKTGRDMRKLMLPQLEEILRRRQGEDEVFVFPALHSRARLCSTDFSMLVAKLGIGDKLEGIRGRSRGRRTKTFHCLRATAVTWLLEAGVPPEMVRHIVGHSTEQVEREHYFRPTQEKEQQALEKLAADLEL